MKVTHMKATYMKKPFIAALVLCLAACGGQEQETDSSSSGLSSSSSSLNSSSDASSSAVSSSSASSGSPNFDLEQAQALYITHCTECHGSTGKGAEVPVPIDGLNLSDELLANAISTRMPNGTGPLSKRDYKSTDCEGDCAMLVAQYINNAFPGNVSVEIGEIHFEGCDLPEGAPAQRALRQLTRHEYQNSVNDIFNVQLSLTTNFPQESRVHGFTNNADTAFVTARHLDVYYAAAAKVATEVTSQENFRDAIWDNGLGCGSNTQCLDKFLDVFGQRIFRRPLTAQEKADYLPFFQDGITDFNHSDHFRTAIKQGIVALLMSPNFLYRSELGALDGDFYRLSQWEIASLLSYTYTGSSPDEQLLAAAGAGQLQTKAQLKDQAERLLASARGREQMAHFAAEWWDADAEVVGSKNEEHYPGYGPQIIQSMVGELKNFFLEVAFNSTGSFEELFTADYNMVNDPLSRYYGFGGQNGTDYYRVTNPQATGMLSLGAIMAANASTEETSPVKRGIFVREQILCDELPPIPRDVNIAAPDLDPTKPIRERFTAHSANEVCWTCHRLIDDIGYALENFDAAGKFRTTENNYGNNLAIRTDGLVQDIDGNDDDRMIADRFDLAQIIAEADSSKACMTRQYYRYVGGYSETSNDACAINNLNKIFSDNQFNIQALLVGITQLDSFVLRSTGEE